MAQTSTHVSKPLLRFDSKKVVLAGRFRWQLDELLKNLIPEEGGELVKKVTADVDYVVVGGDSQGIPGHARRAEELNQKKTAGIQILDEQGILDLLMLSKEEAACYIRSGETYRLKLLLDAKWYNEQGYGLDLSGADLTQADIDSVDMSQWVLEDSNLSGSRIVHSKLCDVFKGINFDGSQIESSYINDIESCTFKGADLNGLLMDSAQRCDFSRASLRVQFDKYHAKFQSCQFVDTRFQDSLFLGVDFTECDLTGSSWERCTVRRSVFKNSILKGASFKNQDLMWCEFVGCDLTGADFTGANLSLCKFYDTKLDGAKVSGATLCNTAFAKVERAEELHRLVESSIKQDKAIDLENLVSQADKMSMTAIFEVDGQECLITFSQTGGMWTTVEILEYGDTPDMDRTEKLPDFQKLSHALVHVGWRMRSHRLVPEATTIKLYKGPVKSKDARFPAVNAVCSVFGLSTLSELELKKLDRERTTRHKAEKKELLAMLTGGANGIAKWNSLEIKRRRMMSLKKADLVGKDLTDANLESMEMCGANLSDSILKGACLKDAELSKAVLSGADLSGANCSGADFSSANLKGSCLVKANFDRCQLFNSSLEGATMEDTVLERSNLNGASLIGTDLSRATLRYAYFNEKTRLPDGFNQYADMRWTGSGKDPVELQKILEDSSGEPLDFAGFLKRLEDSVDPGRLTKALKMLKADSFQLYCEVTNDFVAGVVKSQTSSELVYACGLTKEGEFYCGTQNLNPCGGLRGALCKHLLVLILGLTKAGELDTNLADKWARVSKMSDPKMDKDKMSDSLLKYKGAEAGEIDWRPTETIPEDFYAF